jgi:alpha-tubulin suppressor-like RCC1 family protein
LYVNFPDGRPELPHLAELEADYEFIAELARGETEAVYHARERELERDVVLKVAHADADGGAAVSRLRREAVALGSLRHPHIATLYGVRRVGAHGFALAMEFVRGRTLRAELQAAGALPIATVVRILTEVGEALHYAHGRGVVHGNITPDGIYLDGDSGTVLVAGWGGGPVAGGDAVVDPAPGQWERSCYQAPEQIAGGEADRRSDLYSLGLIGCDMLVGLAPAGGRNQDVPGARSPVSLSAVAQRRPDLPDGLRLALAGALHPEPAQRWADATRFLTALADPGDVRTRLAEARTVLLPVAGASRGAPAPASGRGRAPAHGGREEPSHEQDQPARPPRRRIVMIAGAGLVTAAILLLAFVVGPWLDGSASTALSLASYELPESGPQTAEPALLYALFGDVQEGVAGDTLAEQLVLRVEDAAGQPVAGATVHFTVREGESVVAPGMTSTDDHGLAGAWWIPGSIGWHEVVATVENMNGRASFRAQARPPGRLRLRARSPAEVQVEPDSREPVPVAVRVVADGGEPITNATVRFAVRGGAGRVVPEEAVTAADGTVRVAWHLGPEPAQELVASLADVPEVRLGFRASRTAERLAVRSGLALGGTHSCVLRADGQAVCWGGNDSGQLGDGAAGRTGSPVVVAAPEPLAALGAGVSHTCGVTVSGTVYCWGGNSHGQLGDGSVTQQARPVRVTAEQRLVSVAAGLAHSCALDVDGRLFCWGQNTHGQLGDGSNAARRAPVRAGGQRSYRAVAAGWAHTCGLDANGAAWCWGRNASGELGIGSTDDRAAAVPVHGGHRFAAIAAGSHHVCALRVDGAVLCWGQNNHGQLGNGTMEPSLVPHVVAGDARYSAIAVGGVHSCALARTGAAYCWGRNTYGQLGEGTTQDAALPAVVAGGLRFSGLHASGAHTCGTTADGRYHCWGYNAAGQLGTATRTNASRPAAVTPRW